MQTIRVSANFKDNMAYLPWIVTFLVAFTVEAGAPIIDRQVYCPPCDVCRGLKESVRVVVEPVVL